MTTHDPVTFAGNLSAKLAARSRHVCAFLGAGASRASGLPDISALEKLVLKDLDEEQREVFSSQLEGRNLEQALSRLRRIHALIEGTDETIDGIDASTALSLDRAVCRSIVLALATPEVSPEPVLRLAAWLARADYLHPVEVFTINYDLLIETGLDALGVPYFDGFVGILNARFRTDMVEAAPDDPDAGVPRAFVRLWKLHGSANWQLESDETSEVLRLGQPVPDGAAAAIYPSDLKYEESRRVPFVVLQDRLRRALAVPETLMLISGYSWSDEHLNEMLIDAAARRPRSELVAFCYSEIPDSLAAAATTTANLQAVTATEGILSGVRANWSTPDDPPQGIWSDGKLALRDFGELAHFLATGAPPRSELEARLAQLLARAAEDVRG